MPRSICPLTLRFHDCVRHSPSPRGRWVTPVLILRLAVDSTTSRVCRSSFPSAYTQCARAPSRAPMVSAKLGCPEFGLKNAVSLHSFTKCAPAPSGATGFAGSDKKSEASKRRGPKNSPGPKTAEPWETSPAAERAQEHRLLFSFTKCAPVPSGVPRLGSCWESGEKIPAPKKGGLPPSPSQGLTTGPCEFMQGPDRSTSVTSNLSL